MQVRLQALIKPLAEKAGAKDKRAGAQRAHEAAAECVAVQDHHILMRPGRVLWRALRAPKPRLTMQNKSISSTFTAKPKLYIVLRTRDGSM